MSCVNRAQPLTSNSFNFVLVFRIRCKNSSFIKRDSAANDATDNSSKSGKPGESIYTTNLGGTREINEFLSRQQSSSSQSNRFKLLVLAGWPYWMLCVNWWFVILVIWDNRFVISLCEVSHVIWRPCLYSTDRVVISLDNMSAIKKNSRVRWRF